VLLFGAPRELRRVAIGITALAFAALLTAPASAAKLSANDLMGRWCGSTTDYYFVARSLTVTWHADGARRVVPIRQIVAHPDYLDVQWATGGNTVFWRFSDDKTQMEQAANTGGDMGPAYRFHRC
jgi:hypothetical protein